MVLSGSIWTSLGFNAEIKTILILILDTAILQSDPFKFRTLAFRHADTRLTLLYWAILGKSYSLLQCRCSCQFFVHSSLYCVVVESWKSTKTRNLLLRCQNPCQKLASSTNQKPRNLLHRRKTGNTEQPATYTFWHVGPVLTSLALDKN